MHVHTRTHTHARTHTHTHAHSRTHTCSAPHSLIQVIKLDLQHNELATLPRCILELPSLQELNLSHNKITEIPDVPEWSSALTVLDFSYNLLQNLPVNVVASSVRALNLSHNHFRYVPICICSFTTLHSLDLSDNPDILTLPAEMGRLTSLTRLNLKNLKDLNDPPRNVQRDTRDTIRYLNSKLRCAKGFFRMKLMLVGLANRGKTTLVARLQGKDCGDESTVGVDVSEWLHRPGFGRRPFYFSIWDFGGQEEYYATHQCFLSQRSLYLLLFNLKDEEKGVQELRPWLNNIALRAPRSRIIIVGSHLDEIPDDKRGSLDRLLQKVQELAHEYTSKLDIVEIIPVGLKNRIENIGILKEAVYNQAATYKAPRGGQLIMGQKIPASYHALDKHLEVVQQEVRSGVREPIMHTEEFKTMVQQMNLADIQDEDELKTATLFLSDVGSLLHYDDRSHNLHELYFIDPRWLCDMMAKVVTIRERNPFVRSGILLAKDIPMIFRDNKFPWQYYEQYLTLLDRFEIALPLDNKRILIPSMLPKARPPAVNLTPGPLPFYSRYIIFSTADTPPGFWSRLLSRIMHSVPEVCFALDKSSPSGIPDASVSLGAPVSSPPTSPTPPDFADALAADGVDGEELGSPSLISGPFSTQLGQGPEITSSQLLPPTNLPNFPNTLPLHLADTFDASQIKLIYWGQGLFYLDPHLSFRIESLRSSGRSCQARAGNDGILIETSPNNHGKKIIGQLVDIVTSLVNEWYPGLQEGVGPTTGLEQRVPCYECLKIGAEKPFEFIVEKCLPSITRNLTTIECGANKDEPLRNHTVKLDDIVPDLLLQDIDPRFLLKTDHLDFKEDDSCLLGKGGYGKVYRGQYGMERHRKKPVAIKKYLTRNEEAFTELRTEAKLLQRSHHPCLVCLVGVCIHPIMALVMEEAPKGSLEKPLIKQKLNIHRIVIHRISTEITAALRFLHNTGIIFRDLKAQNVLLWSLDPESLCHAKLTDFGIATYSSAVGAKGLIGTKGFIAPEVLYVGKRKQHSVYDHKADIFSFAMFLYQMITRRHPYHDLLPQRIDSTVEAGERPKLQDVPIAETSYHYLTRLMKVCWEDNPRKRPSTDEIITTLSQMSLLSIMCLHPVRSRFSLRHVLAITPDDFTKAGVARNSSELWVCCDGAEGAEVNIYATNTMVKVGKNFIKENQVQCISLCTDHVWVGSRAGIEYGVIDIFSTTNRELVHNIRMRENAVSCIASTEKSVYLGTLEGYVFAFTNNIKVIQQNAKPRYKYVSEHAVDGIVITEHHCWVSHTRYIYFLNLDNLALEGSVHRQEGFIGRLCLSSDGHTVWSAHLGGTMLSAWDSYRRTEKFHINVAESLHDLADQQAEHDFVITAVTPAVDTVWVGSASGHILIYHDREVLGCFQPYKEYIRFLSCIPCPGPSATEECMVVSGGKGFQSPVALVGEREDYVPRDEKGQIIEKADNAGFIILWEAFSSKALRQIRMIQEDATKYLENHHQARKMLQLGEFKDGTHIMDQQEGEAGQDEGEESYTQPSSLAPSLPSDDSSSEQSQPKLADTLREHTGFFTQPPSPGATPLTDTSSQFSIPEPIPEETLEPAELSRPRARTHTICHDTFDVRLSERNDQLVRVACPRPAQLEILLGNLHQEVDLREGSWLEYRQSDSGECVPITSQDKLDSYIKMENRPLLFLARPLT